MTKTKSLHEHIKLFHKLAFYGDRGTFLESAAQSAYVPNYETQTPSLSGHPTMPGAPKVDVFHPNPASPTQVLPEQKIVGNPPAKQYPAIPADTQDQLNKLLVPAGKMMPLKLDGKLGPETAKAVALFKQLYNKPATPNNIKETYLAQAHPELETKFPA